MNICDLLQFLSSYEVIDNSVQRELFEVTMFTTRVWANLHCNRYDTEECQCIYMYYAVVTRLRKAASYEQRKTNLGNSP